MDPASIIGIISGVIAIAQAFGKGASTFQKWRKKRKARAKKTCEEELQNSLEAGGPTVKSEYSKHLQKYGEVFERGDDISKLSLMKTAMHLDLAVVEVLLKFAMAPQKLTGLDPVALCNISEQAGKSALTAMAELCQRIHIKAPIPRSLGRHHEDSRSPSPNFSITSRFADQPRDAYTFGTAESIQDEGEAREREEATSPQPTFARQPAVDNQSYRTIPAFNYSSAPPSTPLLPQRRARRPESLQIPRQRAERPLIGPLQIPQPSLMSTAPYSPSMILYSAPPTIRSFSDPFSAQVLHSPFSPRSSIRSFSSQPTSARLDFLSSSRVSTPTRSTTDILREAKDDEDARWAALESPRSPYSARSLGFLESH